jgi:hypothetical protein
VCVRLVAFVKKIAAVKSYSLKLSFVCSPNNQQEVLPEMWSCHSRRCKTICKFRSSVKGYEDDLLNHLTALSCRTAIPVWRLCDSSKRRKLPTDNILSQSIKFESSTYFALTGFRIPITKPLQSKFRLVMSRFSNSDSNTREGEVAYDTKFLEGLPRLLSRRTGIRVPNHPRQLTL